MRDATSSARLRILDTDGERVLCREWRDDVAGRSSVLKVYPASDSPGAEVLARLTNELRFKNDLDGRWAVLPLELVRDHGRSVLLLDDPGGETLSSLRGAPMRSEAFLRFAVALSGSLSRLHERGIIHKDIKPANVLVDLDSSHVWLTGFGQATRLPRERQAPDSPELLTGSLEYLAPEQTGRVNRSVDSRADLYALGVTLYEMLTGRLPFTASDPMEWVYCHIARPPTPIDDCADDISPVVPSIILKLLSKMADDRYQTAAGVHYDLSRCLHLLTKADCVDAFELGTRDMSGQLMTIERLYGREEEQVALFNAYHEALTADRPVYVLVAGGPGVGKTALVNELRGAVVNHRGIFLSAKFDQHRRDIPYAGFAQAFRPIIHELLTKRDAELRQWRDSIQVALGPNGRLLLSLLPELELIIGEQPPVPPVPSAAEAKAQFHALLRAFIRVFAKREHPLVLVLDDLQWSDVATLTLLEDFSLHAEFGAVLLVAAFRNDEKWLSQAFVHAIDTVRKAPILQEIILEPLAPADVTMFVGAVLRCSLERAGPLAALIHAETEGNPSFCNQFMRELEGKGLLRFNMRASMWDWDLGSIRAANLSKNVIDLLLGMLGRLDANTKFAMARLACLGSRADAATLAVILGTSVEGVRELLWSAIQHGYVVVAEGAYGFVHDHVQEAAYSLLSEHLRQETHLGIGRLLLERTSIKDLDQVIYEIVNQLNAGGPLVEEPAERLRLSGLNLRAARKAMAAVAYVTARLYLSTARTLLGDDAWKDHHDLGRDVWLESARCEFLIGEFADAERFTERVLRDCASPVDKAAAYRIRIDLHVVQSRNDEAVAAALESLALFGLTMSPHPTSDEVRAEFDRVWCKLDGRDIATLIDLPAMSDRDMQAAMRVLSVLLPSAIFTDLNLTTLMLCKMVNITLDHGSTDAASVGYVWFGVILGSSFGRYGEGYQFGKLACDFIDSNSFVVYRAKTYLAMELVALWTQPIAVGLEHLETAFRAGVENGDLTYACYSRNHVVTDRLLRGDALDEVWEATERGLEFVNASGFRDVTDIMVSQQRFVANMRGETLSFSTFSDGTFVEEDFEARLDHGRMTTMVCWYWVLKLQARFLSRDIDAALDASRRARDLLWSSMGHIQLLDFHYYSALTITALDLNENSRRLDIEKREALAGHLDRLREWAENGSETFRDKYELVQAEMARVDGRDIDAMRLYERAIVSARDNGFTQNEAIASELAGRYHHGSNLETSALAHLRNAHACFARWGAKGKCRQLELEFPRLAVEVEVRPNAIVDRSPHRFDVEAVVKASQALASEILLPRLVGQLMKVALENAGANHGVLVLQRDGESRIEAEAWERDNNFVLSDGPEPNPGPPDAIVRYVIRTRNVGIIDDAAQPGMFSDDEYIREREPRSVVCFPLLRQGVLRGVLYLENTLTSHVFTPSRTALLEQIALQAAISLENVRLYADLQDREADLRRLVESNIVGVFIWNAEGFIVEANDAFLRIGGYDRSDAVSGSMRWSDIIRRSDRSAALLNEIRGAGTVQPFETELRRRDGGVTPALFGAAAIGHGRDRGVAFVVDLSERKQAEREARRSEQRYREVQAELAHANRVSAMGHLAASIAHEVNQPIAAVIINAQAALRWMHVDPSDLDEVRTALARIVAPPRPRGPPRPRKK